MAVALLIDTVLELTVTIAEHTLLILLQYLIPLVLHLLGPGQFRLRGALLVGPFLLEALQPANFHLVQVVLLSEHLELALHLDDQFVLQGRQFDLQLSPLPLMLGSEIVSELFGVLLHEFVDAFLLADFQFAELFSEI